LKPQPKEEKVKLYEEDDVTEAVQVCLGYYSKNVIDRILSF